jgi:hypothetical protein
MKETVIWESPVKGKGVYCYLKIDDKARTALIFTEPYGPRGPHRFETEVRCDSIEIYDKSNNRITRIWTHEYPIEFPIYNVTKIVKNPEGVRSDLAGRYIHGPILEIYCSDKPLYEQESR